MNELGLVLPKYKRDDDGNLVLAENGDPIPLTAYPSQNITFMRDDDGNLVLDGKGNPITKEPVLLGYKIFATMLIRSAIPGVIGELTFTGDEELLKALGLATIQGSRESEFTVTVYDAHSNKLINSPQKVAGNTIHGAITSNVDVRFNPLANINVTWNERTKRFDFTSAAGVYTTFVHLTDRTTILQTGANEGEDFALIFSNVSSSALGLNGLLVVSRDTAARAITILDNAISKVSKQRALLGAYQNRLEHTLANLTVTGTNLIASESRIRDADMSKKMLNFTRLQILIQSSTAMMAQANQLPQTVLSLVR